MVRWRFLGRRQGGRDRARMATSGLGRRLACFGIVLLVGLVAAVGAILWDMRATALRDGYRVIALKGVAVAEQTARAVQAVDLVLQDVQADIMGHPVAAPLGSDA